MLTDAEIAAGREIAESTMKDECAVLRKISSAPDPNTGAVVDEWATVYTGKCRLKMTAETGSPGSVGEQPVTITRLEHQVPWDVDFLEVADRVVITASQSPDLPGKAVQVAAPWRQSTASSCRYPCNESTVPEA